MNVYESIKQESTKLHEASDAYLNLDSLPVMLLNHLMPLLNKFNFTTLVYEAELKPDVSDELVEDAFKNCEEDLGREGIKLKTEKSGNKVKITLFN